MLVLVLVVLGSWLSLVLGWSWSLVVLGPSCSTCCVSCCNALLVVTLLCQLNETWRNENVPWSKFYISTLRTSNRHLKNSVCRLVRSSYVQCVLLVDTQISLYKTYVTHHYYHFWPAPLWVHSATRNQQPPERAILSHTGCSVNMRLCDSLCHLGLSWSMWSEVSRMWSEVSRMWSEVSRGSLPIFLWECS